MGKFLLSEKNGLRKSNAVGFRSRLKSSRLLNTMTQLYSGRIKPWEKRVGREK